MCLVLIVTSSAIDKKLEIKPEIYKNLEIKLEIYKILENKLEINSYSQKLAASPPFLLAPAPTH